MTPCQPFQQHSLVLCAEEGCMTPCWSDLAQHLALGVSWRWVPITGAGTGALISAVWPLALCDTLLWAGSNASFRAQNRRVSSTPSRRP